MNLEDRVRQTLRARADRIVPSSNAWAEFEARESYRKQVDRKLPVTLLAFLLSASTVAVLIAAFRAGDTWPDRGAVSHSIAATIDVGGLAEAVAASPQSVWVSIPLAECDGRVVGVDPLTNTVFETAAFDGVPSDITMAGTVVWIEGELCGSEPGPGVVALDSASGDVLRRITISGIDRTVDIVEGLGAVWVTASSKEAGSGSGTLLKIDSQTGAILDRISIPGDPRDAVVAGNSIWVLSITDGGDSRTQQEAIQIRADTGVVGTSVVDVAAIGGSGGDLWVVQKGQADGFPLLKVDPDTGIGLGQPLPGSYLGFHGDHGTVGTLLVENGGIWAWRWNESSRLLVRVDESTGEEDSTVVLGSSSENDTWPLDAAFDEHGDLWIVTLRGLLRVEDANEAST